MKIESKVGDCRLLLFIAYYRQVGALFTLCSQIFKFDAQYHPEPWFSVSWRLEGIESPLGPRGHSVVTWSLLFFLAHHFAAI